jgi:hypothetical protein
VHDEYMDTLALAGPRSSLLERWTRHRRLDRRRALEAEGWRTWLIYRENHRRRLDGCMLAVDETWEAELEHVDGRLITVSGPTPAAVWATVWHHLHG